MARLLETLPLPPALKRTLDTKGFRSVEDVRELSCSELSKELGVPASVSLKLLQVARGNLSVFEDQESKSSEDPDSESSRAAKRPRLSSQASASSTPRDRQNAPSSTQQSVSSTQRSDGMLALDMLEQERRRKHVLTLCQSIDKLLGGGIALGEVTEICGVPGIGKTQFGIQLACDAQIPGCLNGPEGEVVYIDTEGSFMPTRAAQIAQAFVRLVNPQLDVLSKRKQQQYDRLSVEGVLNSIHVFRIHDFAEQVACVLQLPQFIAAHPKVCLIIIDSVSFQFRHFEASFSERTRLLMSISRQLSELVHGRNIAAVVVNQVTTKVSEVKDSFLAPALGETWAHACTTRIMLEWGGEQMSTRYARLLKSPSQPRGKAPYKIGADGIRGCKSRSSSSSR